MQFIEEITRDLHSYLVTMGYVDEQMPDAPDLNDRFESILAAYMPDGVREYNDYPTVSLGWMMYVGMAMAALWDKSAEMADGDTSLPSFADENIYVTMREKRGFDAMDEYIREEILKLTGDMYVKIEKVVGESTARVYAKLQRNGAEPGTRDAFIAYVQCLRCMYDMGCAIELKSLGYKMYKMG